MADLKYDYSKLLGRMREKSFTQDELAKSIGISSTSMNLSLKNKRQFKQKEMFAICCFLNIDLEDIDDYFFCHMTLEI